MRFFYWKLRKFEAFPGSALQDFLHLIGLCPVIAAITESGPSFVVSAYGHNGCGNVWMTKHTHTQCQGNTKTKSPLCTWKRGIATSWSDMVTAPPTLNGNPGQIWVIFVELCVIPQQLGDWREKTGCFALKYLIIYLIFVAITFRWQHKFLWES